MKNDDVIKWYRLFIDDVIEDMESYIETESNLSYQDELHARLLEFGSQFLLAEIKRAREEVLEEVEKIIAESEKKHLQGGFHDDGGVVKSMQTELNKLGKLASKEEL